VDEHGLEIFWGGYFMINDVRTKKGGKELAAFLSALQIMIF
jgi:hypothetical protein